MLIIGVTYVFGYVGFGCCCFYYIEKGQPKGVTAEFIHHFELHLHKNNINVNVQVIPVPRDDLIFFIKEIYNL